MYLIVIIPSEVGIGWNVRKAVTLPFRSRNRCYTFAGYYTSKHDVLIRVIEHGGWIASYVNGKEIWNNY